VLDYLQYRNHQCLDAWRQRRAEYQQNEAVRLNSAPENRSSAA
jgi:hypothetical protein